MRRNESPPRNSRRSIRNSPPPPPTIRSRSNSPARRKRHHRQRSKSPDIRPCSQSSSRRNISPRRTRSTPRWPSPRRRDRKSPPRPSTSRGISSNSDRAGVIRETLPERIVKNEVRDSATGSVREGPVNRGVEDDNASAPIFPSFEDLKKIKFEIKRPELGSETLEHVVIRRRIDEGRRPIFDREEIKTHKIKYDEVVDAGDSSEAENRRASSERDRSRGRRTRSPPPRSLDRPRETRESGNRRSPRSSRSPERHRRGGTVESRRSPRRDDNRRPPQQEERQFIPRGPRMPPVIVRYVHVPPMPVVPGPFPPPSAIHGPHGPRVPFIGRHPGPGGPRPRGPRPPFMHPPGGPRYFP